MESQRQKKPIQRTPGPAPKDGLVGAEGADQRRRQEGPRPGEAEDEALED
jgi:hypothetical protein